jgi:hypothetical protein
MNRNILLLIAALAFEVLHAQSITKDDVWRPYGTPLYCSSNDLFSAVHIFEGEGSTDSGGIGFIFSLKKPIHDRLDSITFESDGGESVVLKNPIRDSAFYTLSQHLFYISVFPMDTAVSSFLTEKKIKKIIFAIDRRGLPITVERRSRDAIIRALAGEGLQ